MPRLRWFNQLHNSLNGGSAGQGGIEVVPAPPALLVDELLPDAEPLADAEPLLPPYPPVFGPVIILQKFAVISSIQNTPPIGACVGAAVPLVALPTAPP